MAVHTAPADFIGRAAELRVLEAAIEQATGGRSSTVLLCGEAGVGKSRLVEQLCRRAARDGALVLVGRGVNIDDCELAYAPVRAALRPLPTLLDREESRGCGGAGSGGARAARARLGRRRRAG